MIALVFWLAAGAGLLEAQEVGKLCAPCHVEQLEQLKKHRHFAKGVGCEICHGASAPHRNSVGATAPDQVAAPDELPALCGECHGAQQKAYASSKHGQLVLSHSKTRSASCAHCHGVHEQKSGAAMEKQCARCHASLPAACYKSFEVGAGKLRCAGCHVPHTLARR